MTCWPVGARVGNVKNNDPSLIERSAAQWTCVDGSPRCSSVWRSSAASRYQPVRDNSRTLPMHRRRCRTGAAICSQHSPRSKMMSPDHGKRKLRLIRHNFCVFAYPLSLALATLSAVSPVASVTSGAAIAFLPEEDCAAFAVRAIDNAESEILLAPQRSAANSIRIRTCVFFWPKRFDVEGPAFEFCMERYSTLLR